MNHAKTYHTRQQKVILQFLESMQGYVTVSQIDEYLKQQEEPVGLTTIYRHLERFRKEGMVQKIMLDGNSGACYQYVRDKDGGDSRFLLKCEDCGNIMDMDCHHMKELYSHVLEEHHFNVDPHRTMFYGICGKCLDNGSRISNSVKNSVDSYRRKCDILI